MHASRVRVSSISTTISYGHGKILKLEANMGIKSPSTSVFWPELSGRMTLLPDRLIAQQYHNLLETAPVGCIKKCL
jgi:hypothetical protein